jgi:putative oxidoreductase
MLRFTERRDNMNTHLFAVGRDEIQGTNGERHVIVPRLVAGLPLVAIGLAHVFDGSAPMRPLVEAADLPAAAILSPAAVAVEIIAGTLLLLGFYARLGSMLTIPTMLAAVYAHLAIDVWPNPADEPPIALPLIVMACATYVLIRGAGAWSLDHTFTKTKQL